MYAEYQSKAFGFKLAVTSSIFKLIRWLLRYQRTRLSPTCTEDSGEDTKKMAAFRQLLVTINEDSALTITAEEAAKLCLMSYSGFASFFKGVMHTSFSQYVLFIKIRRAEQLLLDPKKSITQTVASYL
ncbi:helix-turn-helix domain-containing protein [Paenibacillus sp. LjRoot153]|uniref:helix-turn-helix domain-containing protein n=1 Tax=Paenibacillus sp. LjRoot153 TaxID=3342270 RepID=UPI003F4F468E